MRGLIAEGLLKRHVVSANGEGHTVYKNTVTAKGESEIKRIAKVMANSTASTEAPQVKAKRAKRVAKLVNNAKAAAGDPAQVAKLAKVKTATGMPISPELLAAQAKAEMPDLPASLRRKPEPKQPTA
jgi:hypothetical protein